MKQYKVIMELANGSSGKITKEFVVEAGNKKTAWVRAAFQANQEGYGEYYKSIVSCDEIKED